MAVATSMAKAPITHKDFPSEMIRANLQHHNNSKEEVWFVGPILNTKIQTQTQSLKAEFAHGIRNIISGDTDMGLDVSRLCAHGRLNDAVHFLHVMDPRGIREDFSIYASLLQECANEKALPEGKVIHACAIRRGFDVDISLGTKLVNMYAKCGSLVDARRVLDAMPRRSVVSWTAMISAYARHGYGEEALSLFYQMQRTGIEPNQFAFSSVLSACAELAAPEHGKRVHEDIIKVGFQSDIFVGSALIDMYAKCGSLESARQVFDKMPERNIFSWNAMLTGYAQNGQVDEALKLFQKMPERDVVSWNAMIGFYCRDGYDGAALTLFYRMQTGGIQPNQYSFSSVLPACAKLAALEHGKKVHEDIINRGFQSNIIVGSALIDMYAKCGRIDYARNVFDRMADPNIFSCNAMIAGYTWNGLVDEALNLFQSLPGRDVVSWNAMIAGYGQNGHIGEALKLFQKMPERDIVTWNAMISASVQNGHIDEALNFFRKMPGQNVVSWNTMISGYSQNEHVDEALKLFQKMPERNVVSWNAIIAGYAENGHMDAALKLFQKMPEQDIVSWNVIIAAYTRHGHDETALTLFYQMKKTCIQPDQFTFSTVLTACAKLEALEHGKKVHEDIINCGLQSAVAVENALVDMYAKCRRMQDAQRVFDQMPEQDVLSWTAMVVGYALSGHVDEALKLFQKMPERDMVSWNAMITGYAQNGYVDEALELFRETPEQDVALWNAMIAGCAQNGHVDEALKLFQKMPGRMVVSWNAMITGCAQNKHFNESLNLFRQMQIAGMKADSVTFISVLPACAKLANLESGKEVHANIIRSGFLSDIFVGSTLVDMYAKCGTIENACQVFDEMPERNVVSWTAMIVGYAIHGCGKEALQLFGQMQQSSTKPNSVTFTGVLSACCHAGLVDDGLQFFDCMSRDYHITPMVEHYCCIVDLLGRAGRLDDAHDFIKKMPIEPNTAVWESLLGACRIHNNIELGERVAEHLFELEPKKTSVYVLMSNMYTAAGRWVCVEKVRKMMKERQVKKNPGCSWIAVNKKVYSFLVRDRSHPQTHKIYAELGRLYGQMEEAGYMPDTNLVLHDGEDEQKEQILCLHSTS